MPNFAWYKNLTTMSEQAINRELYTYLDRLTVIQKQSVLSMIKSFIQSKTAEKVIVGYTSSGKPITDKDLKKRVKEAENRMDAGEYITQEELEKEMENW